MYVPPTADQLSAALRSSIRAEIPGSNPWIWPNNLYIVSKVFAQAMRAFYLRLSWAHLQAFVSKADGDYLDLHAVDEGTSREEAQFASGIANATGDDPLIITAGTRMLRADGLAYSVVADVEIIGGVADVSLVAEQTGKAYNCVPGTPLEPEAPIGGLDSLTVGDQGLTGGLDQENDASLRNRLLDLRRNPPHGGSPSEYIRWVRDNKEGTTRVFVQRATPGAGEVTIIPFMDDTYTDGIPLDADIDDIVAILEENAPSDAMIHVLKAAPIAVNIVIDSLVPNLTQVKSAIHAELLAMFRRRAQPGKDGEPFVFSVSWIREAISNATGEESHTLTSPSVDPTFEVNTAGQPEIAKLGSVSYT